MYIQELPLEGVLNVRELGGLPLRDGRMVSYGKLIRTGRLSEMTQEDKEKLSKQWNITTIVDLRNDQEVAEHPDPQWEGASYYQVPIFPGIASGISKEDGGAMTMEQKLLFLASRYSNGRASKLLNEMYPKMVREDFCVQGIRRFFELLLEHEDGALIWHCTSGKDRTGLTGALLLYVLGADMDTIAKEYLHTNQQIREYRENILEVLRRNQVEEETIQQVTILESVDLAYLENCWRAMTEEWGSVDAFLEKRLGLTPDKQQRLKEKYTSLVEIV